jgi:hypothetical protein
MSSDTAPSTQLLRYFFSTWDFIEQMHPWGVEQLKPFLSSFKVSNAICDEIDTRLFVDLMIPRQSDVQRIRVEGRVTGVVFWAQLAGLDVDSEIGSSARVVVRFQRTPVSQFECEVSVAATPMAVVASLVGYHRIVLLSKVKKVRRCCGEKRIVKADRLN